MAEQGDNKSVDMLVRDIYGCGYDEPDLESELIASSLCKTTRSSLDTSCSRENHLSKFKQADVITSILVMICYDLSQIASLHARIHNISRVFFGGYFVHNCGITMKFLKHGISYWSQVSVHLLD